MRDLNKYKGIIPAFYACYDEFIKVGFYAHYAHFCNIFSLYILLQDTGKRIFPACISFQGRKEGQSYGKHDGIKQCL